MTAAAGPDLGAAASPELDATAGPDLGAVAGPEPDATAVTPDLDGAGTPEAEWLAWPGLRAPELTAAALLPASGRVVVVGPHPDDEVLGAGGAMALLGASGADIAVVAVTDGEASHEGRVDHLRRVRPRESAQALAVLGVNAAVIRLGLPDGGVRAGTCAEQLAPHIRPGDLVLAPWQHDGHPDHDATGRAAATAAAAAGAQLVSYLVWTWHWAVPDDLRVPWARARTLRLPPEVARAKLRAARCFASQLQGTAERGAILPPHVLARLTRDQETLLLEGSG